MSSLDTLDMLEATESRDPLREAKYARPPFTEPFRLGELGRLSEVMVVLAASSVMSVRSEVDLRHLWMGLSARSDSLMDLLEEYLARRVKFSNS
jgi:hypothetical protein